MDKQLAGLKAQSIGASYEAEFDQSANMYQANGLLTWLPTGPPVKFLNASNIITTGNAPPDRLVCLTAAGGRLLWVEIKTWKAKSRHKLTKDLHQLDIMKDFERFNAIGIYLVCWRFLDCPDEWILYWVKDLEICNGGIGFTREGGQRLDTMGFGAIPDWYDTVISEALKRPLRTDQDNLNFWEPGFPN